MGAPEPYKDKFWRYPIPTSWVATLEDNELFPPDPEPQDVHDLKSEQLKGLSMWMAQVMDHFQQEECRCFVCWVKDHFTQDCPHHDAFQKWPKEQLNSKGVGQEDKVPTLKNKTLQQKNSPEEQPTSQ